VASRGPPLDDLVVYSVAEVLAAGENCTFERLVFECFTRFPEAFGLALYPEWPDSARVNKAWLRCRTDKGWIVGSVQEGFRLTSVGERAAEKVRARLQSESGATTTRAGTRPRDPLQALLRNVRKDPLFQRYVDRQAEFKPSEMELRRLLGATLETPLRVLRQNLSAFKSAADAYHDTEALDFLRACERMMPH
jgi:hypothetical protein